MSHKDEPVQGASAARRAMEIAERVGARHLGHVLSTD